MAPPQVPRSRSSAASSPAAIGSDTGGSVRIPSAFNGLVGFKTSNGRYPMTGVFPLAKSLDTLGPIATTVRDCAWLDAAMRGLAEPAVQPGKPVTIIFDETILDEDGTEDAVRTQHARVRRAAAGSGRHGRAAQDEGVRRRPRRDPRHRLARWLRGLRDAPRDGRRSRRPDGPARRRPPRRRGELPAGDIRQAPGPSRRSSFPKPSARSATPSSSRPLSRRWRRASRRSSRTSRTFAKTNLQVLQLTMPGNFLDMPGRRDALWHRRRGPPDGCAAVCRLWPRRRDALGRALGRAARLAPVCLESQPLTPGGTPHPAALRHPCLLTGQIPVAPGIFPPSNGFQRDWKSLAGRRRR